MARQVLRPHPQVLNSRTLTWISVRSTPHIRHAHAHGQLRSAQTQGRVQKTHSHWSEQPGGTAVHLRGVPVPDSAPRTMVHGLRHAPRCSTTQAVPRLEPSCSVRSQCLHFIQNNGDDLRIHEPISAMEKIGKSGGSTCDRTH